jgi:hypothetical protein
LRGLVERLTTPYGYVECAEANDLTNVAEFDADMLWKRSKNP